MPQPLRWLRCVYSELPSREPALRRIGRAHPACCIFRSPQAFMRRLCSPSHSQPMTKRAQPGCPWTMHIFKVSSGEKLCLCPELPSGLAETLPELRQLETPLTRCSVLPLSFHRCQIYLRDWRPHLLTLALSPLYPPHVFLPTANKSLTRLILLWFSNWHNERCKRSEKKFILYFSLVRLLYQNTINQEAYTTNIYFL